MSDSDHVLAANRSFYSAFAEQNYEAMDGIWADGLPVSCIHPGWPPLFGRIEVMMSWRDLLRAAARPAPAAAVRARQETVNVYGDTALVLCEEVIAGGATVLAAANLYAREDGQWRLVHHQASPIAEAARRADTSAGPKRRLH